MSSILWNIQKSPAQIFQEEGILFYPQLLEGEELARLREACECVLKQNLEQIDREQPEQRNLHVIRHLERWREGLRSHQRTIMEAVADPRCLGAVEQIFRGPSLFRCTSLFFNPRFESSEGDWHRDLQFMLPDEEAVKEAVAKRRADGIQLQIALEESEVVEYVPYSAARYDSPEEYYIRCADEGRHHCEEGMPNAVRIHQRPGDAIIFNPHGLHRGSYHTDRPRRTVMFTYTPRSAPYFDYFSNQPWMLEEGCLDDLSPRARVYFEEFIRVYQENWNA